MRKVRKWGGEILRGQYMSVVTCEAEDGELMVGVLLHAEDSSAFAHGHLELEQAEQFLSEYAEAVQTVRDSKGIKLS